ncbi:MULTISPECIES: helix-turn-helix transcriptional regulator [Pseudomonas]
MPSKSPGITTAELAARLHSAGYKISRRTIERDLIDLSLMFPLQCNDASAPYGWYWQPGISVELQGITLTEALSLALVEDAIRPLLPNSMLRVLEPRFNHARQKLKTLSEDNHAARWLDKVASVRPDLNLQAPDIPEEILETLQQALLEEKQLQCQYYSAHSDKMSQLTLNPLALVQRGLITYLIGTAHSYTDVRQYQLSVAQDTDKASKDRLAEKKPRRFRVRLVDADDYAIEFTIDNYKTLETECRKALQAWLVLRRDSAPAHVSIRAAKLETPDEWKTPWGDSKPVWLKVLSVEAKQCEKSELKILTRRRAKPKSDSVETRWLGLWMGIREAFPEDFETSL